MRNKGIFNKILSWLTIFSYLFWLKDKRKLLRLTRVAIPLAWKMGFCFSYDCFRQVCALNLITNKAYKRPLKVIVIGDGYGFLSALIKTVFPAASICLVDLGKTLLFQAYYLNKTFPHYSHGFILDKIRMDEDFIYCPAESLEALDALSFDLAVNIASMQEMNDYSVNKYFGFLRKHMSPGGVFYCSNREKKELPGGEISEFVKYPWHEKDLIFIDELCLWYTYFLSFRPPFVNYFDGRIRHCLAILYNN